ncbi:hypothetical protein A3A93_03770 [Candidatus Roizmanbacteria bacterium RIFCSPLOWO2_01_FULL_38_12]|uniref:AI-2E family transporter n=1 Tax=Candidatus Roizmanbacteria bacterium RIFCSPLOWO2_01_FULL_38_12 TaxID=1802061 RepID=A0A1F7IYW8_9BACT|nr:MAG: hypothetical protein A2861_04110 [Candidatus Roizmanbacteria bacterium RIFCSPHIGHO2_01_FULL_38_15]OGK48558.1 MAG: hypothetical protein A3A93_03770 [Candidatus Roizmanbacteria bacterium RIFCSPLOWO2_01_FULL_38_12]
MFKDDKVSISISFKSIAFFTLIPLTIYLLWFVRDLIFSLLIAFILMSALRPGVVYLTNKKIPHPLSVIIIYLLFIFVFVMIILLIVPPIVVETANLFRILPLILEESLPYLSKYLDLRDLGALVPNATNNIFGFISAIFSNTLFIITTLFFGLYFLLEENLLDKFLKHYFDIKTAQKVGSIISKAEKRMSSWFWGELTLMTVVGLFTFIGLNLIGIRYALPLAVFAGLLEVVPNIGPVISSIPAIIIGFSSSYFSGFSAMALYIIVQQFENSLIVPIIMKRAVGLNPILTLIALILGGRIGGILGILLAIPIFLFVETIVHEFLHSTNIAENDRK